MTPSGHAGDAGFTLVEVLIALVLFSLIGVAGFSLLNAIVGVGARADGRLERLAEMQRAMHVVTLDFQQLAGGTLTVDGAAATLRRFSGAGPSPTLEVRYDLDENRLRRTLSPGSGAGRREQILLTDVSALRWRFLGPANGWVDVWPPPGAPAGAAPAAISTELTLDAVRGGLSGSLRRVVRLPARSNP